MVSLTTPHPLLLRIFAEHLVELMPIVYDPVIAESIEKYSEQFVDTQNACYLSIDRPDEIEASLRSAAEGREIRLIVATDAEGILGIGDWGHERSGHCGRKADGLYRGGRH